MTLQEFMVRLREEVSNFEDRWINGNAENPEDWPMEMGFPDWWEQFSVSGMED